MLLGFTRTRSGILVSPCVPVPRGFPMAGNGTGRSFGHQALYWWLPAQPRAAQSPQWAQAGGDWASELQELGHEGDQDPAQVLHGGEVQVVLCVLKGVPHAGEGRGNKVQHGHTCGDTGQGTCGPGPSALGPPAAALLLALATQHGDSAPKRTGGRWGRHLVGGRGHGHPRQVPELG